MLKQFGEEGQRKLLRASVLVVGAGGLGCPALQYLVAAGIGKIGVVDDDLVSLHNLHRQILFTTKDVGLRKVDAAAKRLREMNPEVEIVSHPFRLTNRNALNLLADYDLVVDATDNFSTRYLINDACVLLHKPFVYGAVSQFEGQVSVFNAGENGVNYRDLFPQPPEPGSVLNCADAGVLGVLPGLIGTMQATEVIKLVAGLGNLLMNQLFTYNALTNESFVFTLSKNEEVKASVPESFDAFERFDYDWLCNASAATEEIDAASFDAMRQTKNVLVIDVREEGEQPAVSEFSHAKIPLSVLKTGVRKIDGGTVVLFCQSGKRSLEAARIMSTSFGATKKIYSLKGGILYWKQQHGTKA